MHITVENFRGIQLADFEVSPIALISGSNAAGKSSIALACASALTGESIPVKGLKKSDAGMLVYAGSEKAQIKVKDGDNEITATWPNAKIKTDGKPPQSSVFAAGLKSITDMNAKDRAAALSDYMDALPTQDDLKGSLSELNDSHFEKLWESIQINGWDLAHGQAKDKGVEMKGRWAQVTGEAYGSKKAASWFPEGWGDDLEGKSEQSLMEALTEEREFLEAAIAQTAISDDKRKDLEETASFAIEDAKIQIEKLNSDLESAQNTLKEAQENRQSLPAINDEETFPEPYEGKPVVVKLHWGEKRIHSLLKPSENVSETEKKEIRKKIASADGKIENARSQINKIESDIRQLENQIKSASDARDTLSDLPEPNDNSKEVDGAREKVKRAEIRLNAFKQYQDAHRIHKSIDLNQSVIDVLAPDGLRRKKLSQAAEQFTTDYIEPLYLAAGWKPVTLDEELAPLYAGRSFPLLSESEQFRVFTALQCAMAIKDNSDAVIIDRADILDRDGRNGLFKMLKSTELKSIVCMTTLPPSSPAPDLHKAGLGMAYEVLNGELSPMYQN